MRTLLMRSSVLLLAASLLLTGVAAAEDEKPPVDVRVRGEITSVEVDSDSFGLHTARGEDLVFLVNDQTRFFGPDGELGGLGDLEVGMIAGVAATKEDDGRLLALRVAAGHKQDLLRVVGEITGVVPGQGTFTLETREGARYEFQTGERTRFVSRDGSVDDIHDLKKGMHAAVAAVRREGGWFALHVAVGEPKDRPDVDVRAAGEIISVGSSIFTLHTRDDRTLVFQVTDATKFGSTDGSVDSFGDLEAGMLAIVAAHDDGGTLTALWVGVGMPRPEGERPQRPSREAEPTAKPARGA
ncbi:MAG: hypothetical protein A2Z17_05960 [Gammaproteobacteria bacterium RBG_16_66_13]|nr:MAG: hypothetical protein A2Z17_05960 [Gammaproteobacteria bacterium RBG_16_66_13]